MNRSFDRRLAKLEPRRKGIGEWSDAELAAQMLQTLSGWVASGFDDGDADALRHVAIAHGLEVEPGEDPAITWAAVRPVLEDLSGALEPA